MLRNGNSKFVNAATQRFTEPMNTCDRCCAASHVSTRCERGRDAGSGMRRSKVSYRCAGFSFQDLVVHDNARDAVPETVNKFLRRHVSSIRAKGKISATVSGLSRDPSLARCPAAYSSSRGQKRNVGACMSNPARAVPLRCSIAGVLGFAFTSAPCTNEEPAPASRMSRRVWSRRSIIDVSSIGRLSFA
jgi:hypothetical protein